MTFWETFLAVSTTLFIAWIFNKYISPILDKTHEKINNKILRRISMGKLAIDIEKTSNKMYLVTWYKSTPSILAKIGGTAPETEKLTFKDETELVEWIKQAL